MATARPDIPPAPFSALLPPVAFIVMLILPVPVLAQDPPEPSPAQDGAISDQENKAKTQTLLDDSTTVDMHNDNTILRDVSVKSKDKSGQVSFGPVSIWLGGVINYDLYHIDDIYNYDSGGGGDTGQQTRRLEGTLRSRLKDWGEIKAQYDVEARDWKDLYLRWVSKLTPRPYTITFGNQKEPMGLAWLQGSKTNTAQELATPVDAFADWRSLGVRVHRAFNLGSAERKLGFWQGDDAAMTTSLGVFSEDINNSNGTSLAVTGRVTAGRKSDDQGWHVGIAGSLREAKGNFDKISFRPEIYEADRVVLARPDADKLAIASLEGAHGRGPLLFQAEAYLADYNGQVDGYGAGGYVQASWFVTGQHREYQTDWGVFAPMAPQGNSYIVEVFSRFSHTRGDDDANGWNAYNSITLGGNIYFRRLRGSVNFLYGRSRDPLATEDDGFGVVARAQFLF